jgi:hypothetical protein
MRAKIWSHKAVRSVKARSMPGKETITSYHLSAQIHLECGLIFYFDRRRKTSITELRSVSFSAKRTSK